MGDFELYSDDISDDCSCLPISKGGLVGEKSSRQEAVNSFLLKQKNLFLHNLNSTTKTNERMDVH